MRLSAIINGLDIVRFDGEADIRMISCDSREPQEGSLFVALSGAKFDGADFIKDAISRGAAAIARSGGGRQVGAYSIPEAVAIVEINDPKIFLRAITPAFYGHPSKSVKPIGITGTNGKTTITYLLESIVHAASQKCGVIGTVNYRIGNEILPSKNTTPGYLENQRYLAQLKDMGAQWSVMEVSSHALVQGRVDDIDYAAAVFTNLTQDHLDYHKDMESYFLAKSLLFTRLSPGAGAVINNDDAYGRRLVGLSKGNAVTYGIDHGARVHAQNIDYRLDGTKFDIVFDGKMLNVTTRLVGKYNVYNLLAAAACAWSLNFPLETIKHGLEAVTLIPGRLEAVEAGTDYFVFIDYAHTEDGLVNVLNGLRTVSGKAKIIVVFGCGGDRDRGKRPKMGRAVNDLADYAIVTSDNPRSENPQAVIDEILTGFTRGNYETCVDRREGIARGLRKAQAGDIVLLAGKGHEDYQILKDTTIRFDERTIIRECLSVHRQ